MLRKLFGLKGDPGVGDRLYAHAVAQARDPRFYAGLGVEDRIDARFELYILHVQLLAQRLRQDGEGGREAAQRLFDVFVSAMDNDLRELGVGDLSVAKKMRKLGEQVYGRMSAYEGPLDAEDSQALAEALRRNVLPDGTDAAASALATYALASRARLARQPGPGLMAGPDWAEVTA